MGNRFLQDRLSQSAKLGVVDHAYYPSGWEMHTGEAVKGEPRLLRGLSGVQEALSKKTPNQNKTASCKAFRIVKW